MFPSVRSILPPVPVDESGSSPDDSASGEISGESSTSGASGDVSGSGLDVILSGDASLFSGDQSASGGLQEAEGGSAVIFTSGEPGSSSGSGSGSGEGLDREHSGVSITESGSTSGSGEISGSSGDTIIIMVDGNMVEVLKHQKPFEQELGQGGIDMSGESSTSGVGVMSGSGDISGSGVMYGSGGMSGSGSGEFSGISFVDHSAVDITIEPSGEQEVSGYRSLGSGFHSGFPSGFPSGMSGSGSASGHYTQHRADIIYLTGMDMIEMTVPSLARQPEQGRGVVEVSGEGSGSGIRHDRSGTLDQSVHLSGSGAPAEKLSVALPPGAQITYTDSLGQSGLGEESQESQAGPSVYAVTPDSDYASPTTAPSVSLGTPSVVERPEVVEGRVFLPLIPL